MQKGILITDGADIKAKMAYAGDISTETMEMYKTALEAKYPTYTVTVYEDDSDPAFVDAVVNSPIPQE